MARPSRFPRQHTLSFSEVQSDRLQKEADENLMSLSEVIRSHLEISFDVVDRVEAEVATLDPDGP